MGSSDISPPHVPWWVVPLSTALLGLGVLSWDVTYVLMTRRSARTQSYGMPIAGLALNVGWEIVYALYVAEELLERAGFAVWLLLDLGLVWSTVRYAPLDWAATSPFVGRHAGAFLALMLLASCWGHFAFVSWWLANPGTGHGDKAGKWWRGVEGHDTTELAYWSAGFAQLFLSAASLAMLVVRGHSGGTGYTIWFFRFVGTVSGMVLCNGVLWWYWPEAHSYFTTSMGIFMCGLALICDLAYPVILWHVRKTEKMLPDGRLVRGPGGVGVQGDDEEEEKEDTETSKFKTQ
ncbi:hypothetical protein BX600DRAFT_484536 [Xylariales sp. PMI_506]|nr:hypothetical protein BX600DRAFT_484536 [Xylariales sp. PMI_506]